jgi:hypothetical protein
MGCGGKDFNGRRPEQGRMPDAGSGFRDMFLMKREAEDAGTDFSENV